MISKTWRIEETEFDKTAIEQNGSRFLVANGYMGYRGTLEEFRAPQLKMCIRDRFHISCRFF